MVRIPDTGNQRDRLAVLMHSVFLRRSHTNAQKCPKENVRQSFHLDILLISNFV